MEARVTASSNQPMVLTEDQEECNQAAEAYTEDVIAPEPKRIIKSNSDSSKNVGTGQAFRKYRYAAIQVTLGPAISAGKGCVDSGCGVTIADQRFVNTYLPEPNIRLMASPLSFGLTTDEEKLRAITKLVFPKNLSLLETYLGMTGWLRNYVRN